MSGAILLVDDDPCDAELLSLCAREGGLPPVVAASSGEEALELLGSGRPLPLLVLLDIKMPGIDGLEVLRRLRGGPATAGLLVAMLTSSDLERDREEARRLGCDLFLTKPSGWDGYVELAARLKPLVAARLDRGQPPPSTAPVKRAA